MTKNNRSTIHCHYMINPSSSFFRLLGTFFLVILVLLVSAAEAQATNHNAQSTPVTFITHHDKIPNFAYTPTITSIKDGNWSDTSVWSLAHVPTSTDIVLIKHAVVYDSTTGDVNTIGVDAGGIFRFKTDQNTKLSVGTLQVFPQGTLEVGTQSNPIPAHLTAEIIIINIPIDTTNDNNGTYDPFQFGTGILAIDGTVTMHGSVKSPTFLRLAAEPKAGDATLILESAPSGWNTGDKLILPDTRQLTRDDVTPAVVQGAPTVVLRATQYQGEELVIASISDNVVTLTSALQFDHKGARDADGSIRFMPHVGNLTRNILIRSENPAGIRGHTFFTRYVTVDMRYVTFKDLGRTKVISLNSTVANANGTFTIGTNQIGRYALHIHHVVGPETIPANGYQFTLEGNAIDGSPRWGIALHDSHYGLVKENVIYNAVGAGLVTEDGSETENVIEHNFSVRSEGSGKSAKTGSPVDFGHEGVGFWFRLLHNYVRNNVSANAQSSGFNVFASPGFLPSKSVKYPKYQGANTAIAGQFIQDEEIAFTSLEYNNNEAYGNVANGFEFWRVGKVGSTPFKIANASAWHNRVGQFFTIDGDALLLDGFVARGDWDTAPSLLDNLGGESIGVVTDGYTTFDLRVINSDIQGFALGVSRRSRNSRVLSLLVQDSVLSNIYNIHLIPGSGAPDTVEIRNVRHEIFPRYPLKTILVENGGPGAAQVPHRVSVYSHNGAAGDDFEVFRIAQVATGSTFKDGTLTGIVETYGVPESGLTNAESMQQYGMALGGAIASCTTVRPDIIGYVCPQVPRGPKDSSKPSRPSNLTATAISPTDIDLSWTAATDNIGVLGYLMKASYKNNAAKTVSFRRMAGAVTTYRMSNLQADTSYQFTLSAFDALFNFGGVSNTVTIRTLSGPATNDTQPPSMPTGLTAMAVSDWQIDLAWNPSTDNTNVVAYYIYQDGNLTGASIQPAFSVGGLFPANSRHCFWVVALDEADNLSAPSASVCATTLR